MMGWRFLSSLNWNRSGSAAVEMALVLPLLMVLMFGTFELGKYFLDEHVVLKAVRDGVRYAGRQKFTNMPCGGASAKDAEISQLVKYGDPYVTSVINTKRPRWLDNATVTVVTGCPNSGSYSGIYNGLDGGERVVTISVTVPYASLFGGVGLGVTGLNVKASAQSAVMGI